jgi:RNAse (barnase) inhibitor barstar
MNTVVVDCRGLKSASDFWARYVDVVRPDGAAIFGRNLDAFWDAMSAGGPGFPRQDEVRFIHSEQLLAFDGGAFLEALRRIAREAHGPVQIVFE